MECTSLTHTLTQCPVCLDPVDLVDAETNTLVWDWCPRCIAVWKASAAGAAPVEAA